MDNDKPFGKGDSLDDARGEISVFVRRKLNEVSDLDEVFEFYTTEPSYDSGDAERSGDPAVRYHLTGEARTGRPGVDDDVYSRHIPIHKVPDDVIYRAIEMSGHIDFSNGIEVDE